MEELFNKLNEILNHDSLHEEYEIEVDGNIFNITANKAEGENKINIVVELKEDKFKKYINSLDENIFVEACEKFKEYTGEQLTDEVDQDLFKSVVQRVISEKIDRLKSFLQ